MCEPAALPSSEARVRGLHKLKVHYLDVKGKKVHVRYITYFNRDI